MVLGAETRRGAPDEIGPMLAEALGWAQITAALTLDLTPSDRHPGRAALGGRPA